MQPQQPQQQQQQPQQSQPQPQQNSGTSNPDFSLDDLNFDPSSIIGEPGNNDITVNKH